MENWIALSTISGTGDAIITITADSYEELLERATSLVVCGGTKTAYVTIIQRENDSFVVSPRSVSPLFIGEDVDISITANTTWTAVTEDSWITLSQASGTGNDVIIATIDANDSSARTGEVVFTNSLGYIRSVAVNQGQYYPYSGSVNPSAFSFTYEESSSAAVITSNCEWVIVCPDWITAGKVYGQSGTTLVSFTASENPNFSRRTGTITIYERTTNTPLATIGVTQSMSENIGDNQILYKGPSELNFSISSSYNLERRYSINSWGVNLVSTSYDAETGIGIWTFDAPIRRVGTYAFYKTDVEEVKLPQTVTDIRQFAFANCSALTTVNIADCDNITSFNHESFYNCPNITSEDTPYKTAAIDYCGGYSPLSNRVTRIDFHPYLTRIYGDGVILNDSVGDVYFNGAQAVELYPTCWGSYMGENMRVTGTFHTPNENPMTLEDIPHLSGWTLSHDISAESIPNVDNFTLLTLGDVIFGCAEEGYGTYSDRDLVAIQVPSSYTGDLVFSASSSGISTSVWGRNTNGVVVLDMSADKYPWGTSELSESVVVTDTENRYSLTIPIKIKRPSRYLYPSASEIRLPRGSGNTRNVIVSFKSSTPVTFKQYSQQDAYKFEHVTVRKYDDTSFLISGYMFTSLGSYGYMEFENEDPVYGGNMSVQIKVICGV